MFKCHVCNSTLAHSEYVSEIFKVGNKFCLVENIPAIVCSRCGEEMFSGETSETIKTILYSRAEPIKSIVLDIFSFQQEVKGY